MELISENNRFFRFILSLFLISFAPDNLKFPFFARATDPGPTVNDQGVTVPVA
jgi:hypothetical protein